MAEASTITRSTKRMCQVHSETGTGLVRHLSEGAAIRRSSAPAVSSSAGNSPVEACFEVEIPSIQTCANSVQRMASSPMAMSLTARARTASPSFNRVWKADSHGRGGPVAMLAAWTLFIFGACRVLQSIQKFKFRLVGAGYALDDVRVKIVVFRFFVGFGVLCSVRIIAYFEHRYNVAFPSPKFLEEIYDSEYEGPPKPQICDVGEVYSEWWGISKEQIGHLLQQGCNSDGEACPDDRWDFSWNVRTFVQRYIIPYTRGSGMGYALLVNRQRPKRVTLMVSHCWAENTADFLMDVHGSMHKGEVAFICFLSLYQAEDCAGPYIVEQLGTERIEEGPFFRVLHSLASANYAALDRYHRNSPTYSSWVCYILKRLAGFPVDFSSFCCFLVASWFSNLLPRLIAYTVAFFFTYFAAMFLRSAQQTTRLCIMCSCAILSLAFLSARVRHEFRRFWRGRFSPYTTAWELWRSWNSWNSHGRMLIAPNENLRASGQGLYSRMWCVCEAAAAVQLHVPIFFTRRATSAHLFPQGELGSCRFARCGSPNLERNRDEVMIREFIEQSYVFKGTNNDAYTRIDRILKGSSVICK